ncbi:hypothetical protein N9355_01860 [Crocinitomicaceae bacterium]|nr:hypothetical protein [Crocinitomicaceae bacterium]
MKSSLLLTLGLIFIGSLFTSCYKQKETVAVIKVVDANNQPVGNARVIVYGTGALGSIVVNDTMFTNTTGEAMFNMDYIYKPGQAGVAVLDIEVSKSGVASQGIIKVEQENTTREIVRL